jgi:hypothetical protein
VRLQSLLLLLLLLLRRLLHLFLRRRSSRRRQRARPHRYVHLLFFCSFSIALTVLSSIKPLIHTRPTLITNQFSLLRFHGAFPFCDTVSRKSSAKYQETRSKLNVGKLFCFAFINHATICTNRTAIAFLLLSFSLALKDLGRLFKDDRIGRQGDLVQAHSLSPVAHPSLRHLERVLVLNTEHQRKKRQATLKKSLRQTFEKQMHETKGENALNLSITLFTCQPTLVFTHIRSCRHFTFHSLVRRHLCFTSASPSPSHSALFVVQTGRVKASSRLRPFVRRTHFSIPAHFRFCRFVLANRLHRRSLICIFCRLL